MDRASVQLRGDSEAVRTDVDVERDSEYASQARQRGERQLVLSGLQSGDSGLPHAELVSKLSLAQLVLGTGVGLDGRMADQL